MKQEYELVEHSELQDIKLFIVGLTYRNLHMHRDFELCLLLSGEVTVLANRKSYIFETNDFFVFNPWQAHEIQSLSGEAIILSLQVSPNFCRRVYNTIQTVEFDSVSLSGSLSVKQKKSLKDIIMRLSKYYLDRAPYYEFTCYSMLHQIFYILLTAHPWGSISEAEKRSKHQKIERINRIIDYIESHYTEKILLTDIAEKENLSLTYLSHFFIETFNRPFQQYVTELRLERAKILLETTSSNLTEISLYCGFSDIRYMNKAFADNLNISPQEYRKSIYKNPKNKLMSEAITKQRFFTILETTEYLKMLGYDQ